MIPIQSWEERAGISVDGNNFVRQWMNHNPSVSQTIHITDVTYTFCLEALYLNHFHNTHREEILQIYYTVLCHYILLEEMQTLFC